MREIAANERLSLSGSLLKGAPGIVDMLFLRLYFIDNF